MSPEINDAATSGDQIGRPYTASVKFALFSLNYFCASVVNYLYLLVFTSESGSRNRSACDE